MVVFRLVDYAPVVTSTRSGQLLSSIVPDMIWVSERPVWFSGVRLRARTTVLRLESGGLLLHSPSEPSPELVEAIDGLGEVRWIVAPNCFHHLGVVATAAHYKRAKVVGPRSVVERNKKVELHMEIGDDAFGEVIPEIERVHLSGCPFLDETVLFHRPTGSLIGADLLISAGPKDHWTWRWAARVVRCYGRIQAPPDVRKATARSEAVTRAIESMAKLPIERILVAHCDPIVNDPVGVLEEAWRFARPD